MQSCRGSHHQAPNTAKSANVALLTMTSIIRKLCTKSSSSNNKRNRELVHTFVFFRSFLINILVTIYSFDLWNYNNDASSSRVFAFSLTSNRGESRYFYAETVLPPLKRVESIYDHISCNSNSSNESCYCCGSVDCFMGLFDDSCRYIPSPIGLPVLYTNDPTMVSRWVSESIPNEGCTIGFDVESVPRAFFAQHTFEGPSVVQLATADSALVIHLARNNGRPTRDCVPILRAILSDETIVKVGVSVDQDMLDLMEWQPSLIARSRFDLAALREKVRGDTPGLQKLTASILGLHLPKSRKISTSDWSHVPLSPSQLAYSARDAWVGAAIANKLAQLDPDTFSTAALIERLRSQRPMEELFDRQMQRKRAKLLLSTLLAPYEDFRSNISTSTERVKKKEKRYSTRYPLPGWKATVVKELRHVLTTNIHEKSEVYDLRRLGLLQLVADGKNSTR